MRPSPPLPARRSRALTLATALVVGLAHTAQAIPPDGSYYSACEGEAPAAGAETARLTFPEICYGGACCQLYNPTRLRDLENQFLYDSDCETSGGEEFAARIFFGDGPEENSLVIFLRDRASTMYACTAPAAEALEDA